MKHWVPQSQILHYLWFLTLKQLPGLENQAPIKQISALDTPGWYVFLLLTSNLETGSLDKYKHEEKYTLPWPGCWQKKNYFTVPKVPRLMDFDHERMLLWMCIDT